MEFIKYMIIISLFLLIGCDNVKEYKVTFQKSHGNPVDTIDFNLKITDLDTAIHYMYYSDVEIDSITGDELYNMKLCFWLNNSLDTLNICENTSGFGKLVKDSTYMIQISDKNYVVDRYLDKDTSYQIIGRPIHDFCNELGLVYYDSRNWNTQLKLMSVEKK